MAIEKISATDTLNAGREKINQAIDSLVNSSGNIINVSGAPKGTFDTLSALQSAYPNGTEGVFLVLENGHWYYYANGWKDGGVYQEKGIADGTVKISSLNTYLLEFIENGEIQKGNFLGYSGTLEEVDNTTRHFIINQTLVAGIIRKIKLKTFENGTVVIGFWKKVSETSFVCKGTYNITTFSGEKEYDVNISLGEDGLFLSVYGSVMFRSGGSNGWYDVLDITAPNLTTDIAYNVLASTYSSGMLSIEISYNYQTKLFTLAKESPITSNRFTEDAKKLINTGWYGIEPEDLFNYDYSLATDSLSLNNVYILEAVMEKSTVSKINVLSNGGTWFLYILDKVIDNGETKFKVAQKLQYTAATGENTYNVNINIEKGQYIGVYGSIQYSKSTQNSIRIYDVKDALTDTKYTSLEVNSSYPVSLINFKVGLGLKLFGIKTIDVTGKMLDDRLKIIEGSNNKWSYKDFYSNFVKIRNDWNYTNCSPDGGLAMTGYAKAYLNKYLTFDRWYHKATVQLKDINSKFGLVNHHTYKGAIYIVDNMAKTINLYTHYTGTNILPDLRASVPLTMTLVTDKDYILEVKKNGWTHTFSIKDPKTLEKTTVEFDNGPKTDSSLYVGKGWGGPGVVSLSGSVFFKNHYYSFENYPDADVLFIGHSIVEGTNIVADISNRWCSQLRDKFFTNKKVIISGRGGDNSAGVIDRLNNIYSLGVKTKVVVVLIGMNERSDSGFLTWAVNIQTIYDMIIAQGAIPVICTESIPSSGATYIQQMRDFIISKNWNTIRFDYATTLGRDGISYDSTMFSDGVHPNVKGSDAMYEQAKIDLGNIVFI